MFICDGCKNEIKQGENYYSILNNNFCGECIEDFSTTYEPELEKADQDYDDQF